MKTSPEERLAQLERSRSALARPALAALSLAAGGYAAALKARGWCYASGLFPRHQLSRPVISVGNIEAGGTGKTPLVCLLARLLREAGLKVAVVSRGYRGAADSPVNVVSDGERVLLSPELAGDEPYLMARELPGVCVLTGRRRYQPAQAAVEQLGAQVILLDDGFQHLSLSRDLDIVVIGEALGEALSESLSEAPGEALAEPLDSNEHFCEVGAARLLPRGLLREPLSALGRADAYVLTGQAAAALKPKLSRRFPGKAVFIARHLPEQLRPLGGGEALRPEALRPDERSPEDLRGAAVAAFCGLGAPQRFRRTLTSLGADLRAFHPFPDHHAFSAAELAELAREAASLSAMLVTTEKDAVRCEGLIGGGLSANLLAQVWALGVRLSVDDEAGLRALVLRAAGAA